MSKIGVLKISIDGKSVFLRYRWSNGRPEERWAGDLESFRFLIRDGWPSLKAFLPGTDHAALIAQLRNVLRQIDEGGVQLDG